MLCNEFAEMLDNYESLTIEQKQELEAHAAECESCGRELDSLRRLIEACGALPKIEVPADFIDNVNRRIDAEVPKKHRFNLRTDWKKYSAIAAAFLLIAVVGVNGKQFVSRMDPDTGKTSESRMPSDSGGMFGKAKAVPSANPASAVPQTSEAPKPAVTQAAKEAAPTAKAAAPAVPVPTSKSTQAAPKATVQTREVTPVQAQPQAAEAVKEEGSAPVVAASATDSEVSAPAPQITAAPEAVSENTAPDAAPASTNEPLTIEREGYELPHDNNGRREVARADNGGETENGYTIDGSKGVLALGVYTPLDKDGNPVDYSADENKISGSAIGSSIMVSSADAEKVRQVLEKHNASVYDNYYMMTKDKLHDALADLDAEGIGYEQFINNSTNKISFRIIEK